MPDAQTILGWTVGTTSVGGMMAAAASYAGHFFANRAIDKRKAEFDEQLERTKNQLSADLERIRSVLSQEAETHRFRLKKLGLLFEKELAAATEFLELRKKIEPEWRYPEMEWPDAIEDVTDRLQAITQDLIAFLMKHGSVLTDQARATLRKLIKVADSHKFDGRDGYPDDYLHDFLADLAELEHKIICELRA